jgi:hypothetical protein
LHGARAGIYGRMMVEKGAEKPPHTHLVDFPEAIETLASRMDELKIVLGPAAAPGVEQVALRLREGLAARARGDVGTAMAKLGQAIDLLAGLASQADPAEGAMMRAVAEQFKQALGRGSLGEAKAQAEEMRRRSGSVLHPKKPR